MKVKAIRRRFKDKKCPGWCHNLLLGDGFWVYSSSNIIDQSWRREVRGVIFDKHPRNVSALREITSDYANEGDELHFWISDKSIYLWYMTPWISSKMCVITCWSARDSWFHHFVCTNLFDEVRVAGSEISWRLPQNVHEKYAECQANLRAAPKLSKNALHPRNCKQNVPVAQAMFDPSTRAAILKYFSKNTRLRRFHQFVSYMVDSV